jgi:polyisoprenoid-binding protein YceI
MQNYFRQALRPLCLAAAVVFFAGALAAQEQSFQLNPSTTAVTFVLGDVLHTVHGTFKATSGSIHFDSNSGAASGSFLVDATSGESGNGTRDRKMHKEILESSKFPEITFSPTKITGNVSDGSTVQVEGVFHIHGADHPIALSVPLVLKGDELTAKFHFVVPYVAWGMKNPSTFLLRVGKEVDIDVVAVGRLAAKQ